jgi:DNA-binding NarL/FixJ family response regulator
MSSVPRVTTPIPFAVLDVQPLMAEAVTQLLLRELPGKDVGIFYTPERLKRTVNGKELALLVCEVDWPHGGLATTIRKLRLDRSTGQVPLWVLAYSALVPEAASWMLGAMGANGFVSKTAPISALSSAARAVIHGTQCFPVRARSGRTAAGPWDRLSERELDVLARLGLGQSVAAITEELQIAAGTVETHIKNMRRKFGLHDKRAMERVAESLVRGLDGCLPSGLRLTETHPCEPLLP